MEPTELCENRAETGQNLKTAPAPAPWPMFTRVAVSGMFVLATLYTLYFAKPVLLPIALAMLMAWVLRPLVRSLGIVRIPQGVAAAAVVGGLVGILASGVYLLAEPATKWAEDAPQKLRQVERKASTLKRSIATLQRATDKIDEITRTDSADAPPAPVPERPPLSSSLLSTTQAVLVSGVTTVILLYFLLPSGDIFLRKVVRAIPTLSDKKKALEIARGVETEIGRYLFTVSMINFVLGVAVTLLMYFLRMPNPLLWGTMVALLNFIPYVGATISVSVLAMVAILTFETLGEALAVPAGFLVLTILEGQFAYPLIVGRRFSVNPVLVFVALLFWGWLWGIAGMLMAVPLLVIAKIICSHIESLAVLKELLEA